MGAEAARMDLPHNAVSIDLEPGWNLISLPFQPANPAINSVINANHPADIVTTYDIENQIWLVSRRSAETGLFKGEVAVITGSTAYFIRTDRAQGLTLLRPPLTTAATPPSFPIIYRDRRLEPSTLR